ncbi:hypothetical protein OG203_44500 [Nocardia sp. NBC_01499]|uniref:hypothetical protein n=1 Tax=Nocardia sp. NBC_01499 TaxID=2903597 RepID=UPI00386C0C40
MLSTNRIHALTAPDETSVLPPFDALMAASGLSVSTPPLNEQTVVLLHLAEVAPALPIPTVRSRRKI